MGSGNAPGGEGETGAGAKVSKGCGLSIVMITLQTVLQRFAEVQHQISHSQNPRKQQTTLSTTLSNIMCNHATEALLVHHNNRGLCFRVEGVAPVWWHCEVEQSDATTLDNPSTLFTRHTHTVGIGTGAQSLLQPNPVHH